MSNRRTMTDFPRNEAGLVDEFIGTAYDVVKGVYDALPELHDLHEQIEQIPHLAEIAVEAAMVPARQEINASVQLAENWAQGLTAPDPLDPTSKSAKIWALQAEQSAIDAGKINLAFPFVFNELQSVYDVSVISGRTDITTAGMSLWIEGAIDYNFVINDSKLFTLTDTSDLPQGAKMRLLINARFDDLITNLDQFQDAMQDEFNESQASREAVFMEFLENSDYEVPVLYQPGLVISRPSQTVIYEGYTYRVDTLYLPLSTTNWGADGPKMKLIGDNKLRDELAAPSGSGLLGWERTPLADSVTHVNQMLSIQAINIWEFAYLVVDRPTIDAATWDWAPAIQYALNTHGAVRVPRGTYRVAAGISFTSGIIVGDNPANTILEADYANIKTPLLAMGRASGLSNILLRYKSSLITGAEAEGDRVLIQCYGGVSGFPLQRASLRNVRTQHCGTGVYSPGGTALTNKSCFSIEFSTWEMSDFSYRAFDMQSETRTGNTYRNLYISSGGAVVGGIRQPANAGFVLDGEESETVIDQLNVEHTTFSEAAVILKNIRGLACSTIHLEGVGLSVADKGYLQIENTVGRIGALSVYWTMMTQDNTAIVKLGSINYDDWSGLADPNVMDYINFGVLHLKGIANPVGGDAVGYPAGRVGIQNTLGFKIFSRPATFATLDLFVNVESYIYNYNPTVDPVTSYSTFPVSTNISFIHKGRRRSGVSGAVFSGPHLYVGGATNNSHPMMQDLDAFSALPTFTWWFDQQTGISHPAAGVVGITISNGDKYRFTANAFVPSFTNVVSCGGPGNRFTEFYGTNGAINTSDIREKEQQRSLSEVERDVALALRGQLKAFKWTASVQAKGADARWHFGIMAQELAETFRSHGLDPEEYGMFCFDEWEAEVDDEGIVTKEAGDMYGIRYEELLVFMMASL